MFGCPKKLTLPVMRLIPSNATDRTSFWTKSSRWVFHDGDSFLLLFYKSSTGISPLARVHDAPVSEEIGVASFFRFLRPDKLQRSLQFFFPSDRTFIRARCYHSYWRLNFLWFQVSISTLASSPSILGKKPTSRKKLERKCHSRMPIFLRIYNWLREASSFSLSKLSVEYCESAGCHRSPRARVLS